MSVPSSPLSPARLDEEPALSMQDLTLNHNTITRTVAIIKNHALVHRLDIEPRITEAGFEIVKERQMEFDMESDPEVMYDLFGDDAECFSEGPVRVYVLERRRAIEVWHTLMGDANPVVAQQLSPNSLRALYGASLVQNAVMGSPDYESAELQIASLFASSPPYPVTDLPDVTPGGSMRSMNSAFLQKLQHSANSENGGYAASSGTNPSTLGGQNRRLSFKARIIPTSHTKPDIVPRTTRAASLRAGVAVEKVPSVARAPPTKEAIARTFANVPGHKRTGTITVASTAPPVVAPRMTRAASLRLGQPLTPKPIRTTTSDGAAAGRPGLAALTLEKKSTGFDGVPGHKRRETFSVASTKTPTVAPRTNRSAALRLQKDNAPPSSWGARPPQSLSRSTSATSLNGSTARTPSRPSSVSSIRPTPALRTPSRDTAPQARPTPVVYGSESLTPEKPKPRTSTASAPSIVPRTNKSAALRAAKMALASSTNTNGKPPATRRISTFF